MLKKYLFITAAIFAVIGFQSPVLAEPPAPAPASNASVTPEEAAALQALLSALASATTSEQKQQILADAIAKTPTLASNPQLSSAVESAAKQAGLTTAQINTAITTGLEIAKAVGGSSTPQQTVKNTNTGGGSSTSTATASQASNGV